MGASHSSEHTHDGYGALSFCMPVSCAECCTTEKLKTKDEYLDEDTEEIKGWTAEFERSRLQQTGRRGFESTRIENMYMSGCANAERKHEKRFSTQSPRQHESAPQTVSQLLKKRANMNSQLTDRYSEYDALIGKSSSGEKQESNQAPAQAEVAEITEQDVADKYNRPVSMNVGLGRRSSTSPVRRESPRGHGEGSTNLALGRRQSASPVGRRSSTHGHGESEQNHAAKSHSSSHRKSHGAGAVAREGEDVQKHASKNHSSAHHIRNNHGAGAGAHSSAAHDSSVEAKSSGSTPRHRDAHHSSGPVVLPSDYLTPDYVDCVNAGHKSSLRKSYGTRTEDTFKPIDPMKDHPSSNYR